MFPNAHHQQMPPPQARSVAPETFLLDQDAQQSLPPDSIVALQQVDNRTCLTCVSTARAWLQTSQLCTLVCADPRCSQVLPYLSTRRLATRPVYSQVPPAHRRIRLLRSLVSAPAAIDYHLANWYAGTTSFTSRVPTLYDACLSDSRHLAALSRTQRSSRRVFSQISAT
jgi:hypothetical protein